MQIFESQILNIITGIILIILGFIWLTAVNQKANKYYKNKSYGQLSTQPSQYLGVLILGGIMIVVRAL